MPNTPPLAEPVLGVSAGPNPAELMEQLRVLLETARLTQTDDTKWPDNNDPGTSVISKLKQSADAHINRVAFKTPQPLFQQNPSVWFNILEQLFQMSSITTESTKYSHALSALDPRLHNTFADLILRDKGDNPYTTFRDEVTRVLGDSKKAKINNILHGLSLGDKKPSQLLSEFKLNAGSDFADKTIQQLWMSRLPQQVQMVLTPFENDVNLSTLAERADAVYETMSHSRINAIDGISPQVQSTISAAKQTVNIESLLDRFRNSIIGEVKQLIGASNSQSANARSRSPASSNQHGTRSRSSSKRRLNSKYTTCYYHYKFGDKAQKCVEGCTFRSANNNGNTKGSSLSNQNF